MSDDLTFCTPCNGDGKRLWFDWSGGSEWRVCEHCDGTGVRESGNE